MNELQTFSNAEFGEIRSITIENIPYFVGRDVASILGYASLSHFNRVFKEYLGITPAAYRRTKK